MNIHDIVVNDGLCAAVRNKALHDARDLAAIHNLKADFRVPELKEIRVLIEKAVLNSCDQISLRVENRKLSDSVLVSMDIDVNFAEVATFQQILLCDILSLKMLNKIPVDLSVRRIESPATEDGLLRARSMIRHERIATLVSGILDREVRCNHWRLRLKVGDVLYVTRVNGRLCRKPKEVDKRKIEFLEVTVLS